MGLHARNFFHCFSEKSSFNKIHQTKTVRIDNLKARDFILQSEEIIEQLSREINHCETSLKEAEEVTATHTHGTDSSERHAK